MRVCVCVCARLFARSELCTRMMLTEPGGRGTFRLHLKELRRSRAIREMRLEGNLHLLLASHFRRVVEGNLRRRPAAWRQAPRQVGGQLVQPMGWS